MKPSYIIVGTLMLILYGLVGTGKVHQGWFIAAIALIDIILIIEVVRIAGIVKYSTAKSRPNYWGNVYLPRLLPVLICTGILISECIQLLKT